MCFACPAGRYIPALGGVAAITECATCVVGSTTSLALCNPCRAGSFSSEGAFECIACEISSYAAAASSICECNAGFTRQAGLLRCTACAKGKFKESTGDMQCLLCPAGTYYIDIGAISKQMCRECGEGETSPVGSSSLSDCERIQEQCSFSNLDSGAHIEFQINLPYSSSTFTTEVQDKLKVGVASACRADSVCQISKSQVEITSILESSLPRRRLHATSISVGLMIFVESEADSNKIIGGLTKDNLNRELQTVGVEPMTFVSSPTTVVASVASGGETALLDSGIVVALIVAVVATVASASFLYCCYVRMGSRVDPNAKCIRVPIKATTGAKVTQSVLPVEIRSSFEADCVLGSGTNGKVIKVWNLIGGRRTNAMAIKFLYPLDNNVFTEQQVWLLKQEAAVMKQVKSPFVVTYTTYAQTETEFAIVMECLDGYSLDKLIEDRTREGIPPMNETEALACINDVLQGLQAIHEQNLVHRNIKPSSIFLVEKQTLKRYVVTDLGSAALTMTSELEASNTNTPRSKALTEFGTLEYMPPESAHFFLIGSTSTDRVNMQSDLYSTGASLFHLVSGRVPFQGSTPEAIRFNIVHEETPSLTQTSRETGTFSCSSFFSKLVEMAMHKDMEKRFATAQDMLKLVQNPTVSHTFVEDYVCDESQVLG